MPYIGTSPSQGVRRVHTYTATANQTSFSGAGAEGATLSYKDSNFVDVYQNGVKLGDADYTATSGTAIVLGTGATVSDLVVVVAYDVFSAADTVSKADGGQFDGNVTMAGTLAVTGTTALTGNATMAGTLGVTGAVTANAGVVVDNITIDGTEIDLSSGDLTLDVAGDIILDADGGDIILKDGGTQFGTIVAESGGLGISSAIVQDSDIIFKGNDGGSTITALTLDMSAAGDATFNNNVTLENMFVAGNITHAGDNDTQISFTDNEITLDSGGDIILDADSGAWRFKDGGTSIIEISKGSGNVTFYSPVSDADILFRGNDGGSAITALTLDMSDGGAATLNNGLTLTDGNLVVASGHGIDFSAVGHASGMTSELLHHYEEGTWTPTISGGFTSVNINYIRASYTRIGEAVHIFLSMRFDGTSAGANFVLGGLPFTSQLASNSYGNGTGSIGYSTLSTYLNNTIDTCYIGQNGTSIQFYTMGGVAASSNANASNDWLELSATYPAQ